MSGWIKAHRAIRDHWIFSDAERYRAWMIILFEVNFEPKKEMIHEELITCNRGQSIYSLDTWAKKFGKKWTIQKVRTFFNLLKKDKMITTEGLRKTTRLTVCNYGNYQDDQQTDNRQITDRQQTDNKQITTTKEGKEGKEGKEIIDCLNFKTNKSFKSNSSKTISLIKARKNEGFTVDDFKRVIEIKCKQWLGTDQEKYLRPETLFGNKFEGYLNESPKQKQNTLNLPVGIREATEKEILSTFGQIEGERNIREFRQYVIHNKKLCFVRGENQKYISVDGKKIML